MPKRCAGSSSEVLPSACLTRACSRSARGRRVGWSRPASTMTAIAVTGHVDDERPYLARCAALVLPLRSAAGSRLKALVAMASGAADRLDRGWAWKAWTPSRASTTCRPNHADGVGRSLAAPARAIAALRAAAGAQRAGRWSSSATTGRLFGRPCVRRTRSLTRDAPCARRVGGWLLATLGSLCARAADGAESAVRPLDTLSIDLRHRWVALTAPTSGPDPDDPAAARPPTASSA